MADGSEVMALIFIGTIRFLELEGDSGVEVKGCFGDWANNSKNGAEKRPEPRSRS